MKKRTSPRTCRNVLLPSLCLALLTCFAGGVAKAETPITASEIIDRMRANTGKIEDMTATITIETYKDGALSLTQTMELILQQPDKMRQEYLSPDYLAGNATIIVGEEMWIYIAATDQWLKKDLSSMSPAQQPWVMFREILTGVRSELDDYTFDRVDDDVEGDTYHIRGTPADEAAAYGQIDLWVDRDTFVPVRRTLYDTDGNPLVDARFLDPTRVDDIATIPLRIETYDADGVLKNVITYSGLTLNNGVSEAVFTVPEGADD